VANEITIPALPCASMDDTLGFYVALGFKITYQQTRPNTYGVVKYEDIELHFFAMKGVDPANSYSTCLVLVDDADALYKIFAANLRQHYQKLPVAGIPRITKPNNKNSGGDWRFNVVDTAGNWIRFIQRGAPPAQPMPITTTAKLTPLGRAIMSAELLVNGKGDFPEAAKVLDAAFAQHLATSTNAARSSRVSDSA
jgi:catechol 2,3-dioxygenase-like lactoylglutathione lyase family enzyme